MSDNIHGLFDLSAKGPKKKPQKTESGNPLTSSRTPLAPLPVNQARNQDVQAQIEKMKELNNNFSLQLEETMKKAGQDPQTITKFCQNPSNFTKEQWEQLQKKKEELELMFSGLSKEALDEKKKKKAVATASKERRGKTLGSRKNWLDMR